ncbi:MAG: polyprenyl diphosphate synthase [Hyphomicrobiaceae bacterium]
MPRSAGHHAGVAALREVVHAAPALGISTLTVFGFSVDNWRRPTHEVNTLMVLIRRFLERELAALVRARVRLTAIGRRDRFPEGMAAVIAHAEEVTAKGTRLNLRLALDYSSRDAILQAAKVCRDGPLTRQTLSQELDGSCACGDVDLVVRTSGEKRLSDFVLWEAAYAELYFTDTLWPDFGTVELAAAVGDYTCRDRRFGGLSPERSRVELSIPAITHQLR